VLALGGSLLATVTVAIPLIQRDIVNDAILTGRQPSWIGVTALVLAAALSFAGGYARRYYGGGLSLEVQHEMRTQIFASLSGLDGMSQDRLRTGQIVSRSSSDLDMVQGLLSVTPLLLAAILLLLGSVTAMAILSPRLTLVVLAVSPVLAGISVVSRDQLFAAGLEVQQAAAGVAGVVDGAVTGVRVVKGFGQEDQEVERLADASRLLYASRVRVVKLMARYAPALRAVPALGQVGVLAYGGYLAVHGEISLGTFLAFSAYLTQLAGPVTDATGLIPLAQEARASVIRVFEVIDSCPVVTEKPDAISPPAGAHDVELDDVTFGYLPSEPVLRGLTLRVDQGETVAVVGASGSGKSTISQLLPRFYDVTGGAVRIGGHDVRDLTLGSLRACVGLVMEDSFLFSDTIRANICYGRPDATDEQVVAAAKVAEADKFITGLPDGYRTVIGERGLTLSGGQRQRLALARALITDPAILVLDDATSAVDARTEIEIHETLRRAMTGRTTILIAHRRSTLRLADKIAVLEDGRLAELGTHDELTERCPLYRSLLAGPAENAEGVDGGEPVCYRNNHQAAVAAQATRTADQDDLGLTPGLWPASSDGRTGQRVRQGTQAGAATNRTPDVRGATSPPPGGRFTLGRLLRPFAIALLAGLILDGLDAIAAIAMPWLTRTGVDRGITAKDLHAIMLVSMVALAIVLADWLVNVIQTVVVGRSSERLLHTLRVTVFTHLQRLGLDFYEQEMAGRIMTRMTTDIDAMSTFLQVGLITMVNSGLTVIGIMIALLLINVSLGLILLSVLPVLIVATLIYRVKTPRAYAEARERVSAVNASLQENLTGLRATQAYRRERDSNETFAGLSRAYLASRLRAQRYIGLYFPLAHALAILASAILVLAAAGDVRHGLLTAGSLIAYLLYIDMLFSPVRQLSQVFDGYQQASVGAKRTSGLLRTPASPPQSARPVQATHLRGEVELAGVRFSYRYAAEDAIAGVSLHIAAGERVAFVGRTGAGKSTLVKLVARFYDVTQGKIVVDGVDVRDYDLGSYRRQLGIVPQEPYLSAGTLRDAIAYGRPDATDAEVEAAARWAGAIEMISRLPGGFSYQVAERGRNLSAGQRQLVALARAYLVSPAVLLLDEATAALDQATETAVIRASEQLMAGRTTLLVTHRLSVAAQADRIIVLDAGRIAETGTHDQLIAAGGLYSQLWAAFIGDTEVTTTLPVSGLP
jgi:ATP-binding cassette, subfamily B, bacterial